MAIDPGYGSSAFGIVVTQWANGIVQIMHAEEYHRPDYNEMLSLTYGLMTKYNVDKVYIDGANPSFIRSLKLQIGEDADCALSIFYQSCMCSCSSLNMISGFAYLHSKSYVF